ncbi:MAG: carboxypeptidase-like regulatory domain-containing protein [Thermoproteota archaeon]
MRVKPWLLPALLIALSLILAVRSEEGELTVGGDGRVVISGRALVLTGNVTVKDAGQLIIEGSRVQLSIRGEKAYNVSVLDYGRMLCVNSGLETLSTASIIRLSGHGNLTLINANVTGFNGLYSTGNSTLKLQGGRLNLGSVDFEGKSVSLIGGSMPKGEMTVKAERVEVENFKADKMVMQVKESRLKRLEGDLLKVNSAQPVYLNNSKVKDCYLRSDGEVVVADSSFESLAFLSSGVAVNTTTTGGGESKAGGAIYAGDNAVVHRYWYLRVEVTDLAGAAIPAKVIVTDYFGNMVAEGEADVEGVFRRPMLAEVVNGSKTVFVGNYRVRAEYLNYTTRFTPIVLDGNRDVKLRFTEYVPLKTATVLTVSPTTVKVGNPVKVRGWITSGQPGEYVEVVAIGPGELRIESAYKTGDGGIFEGEFKPNVEGRWIIYAEWMGGPQREGSTKSRAFTIIAEPRPSIPVLLIRAMPITIVVLGVITAISFLALARMKVGKI